MFKKSIYIFIFFFLFINLFFLTSLASATDIGWCATLDSANTVYVLNQSVGSSGTCFTVTAQNVTLDCNGFNVNYTGSSGYGLVTTVFNTIVKNCAFNNTGSSGSHAVYFNGANTDNSTVYNTTIALRATSSNGVYLNGGSYCNITNVTVTSPAGTTHAYIRVTDADYSVIDNVDARHTSSGTSYGIYVSSTDNINIMNSNVTTIAIADSRNTTIHETNFSSGLSLASDTQTKDYYNVTVTNSYKGGKLINYTFDYHDFAIQDVNAGNLYGQWFFAWCRNVTLNNVTGLSLAIYNSSNATVTNGSGASVKDSNDLHFDSMAFTSGFSENNNFNLNFNNISLPDEATSSFTDERDSNYSNVTVSAETNVVLFTFNGGNHDLYFDNLTALTDCTSCVSGTTRVITFAFLATDIVFNNSVLRVTRTSGWNGYSPAVHFGSGNSNVAFVNSIVSSGRWNDTSFDNNVNATANFTNCTINKTDVGFGSNSRGLVNVFWYADAYANDTAGTALENVNVSAYDVNSVLKNTQLTNSLGYTQRIILREYMQNKTAQYFDTNYTFNGTKAGYTSDLKTINLTSNAIDGDLGKVVLTLTSEGGGDTTPPTFTTIPANASIFYLNETLLVTFTGTDETGFGYYSQNDSRFTINQTGFLYNNTQLGAGIYTINVTINDTSNNINWTIYQVTIKQATPSLILTSNVSWTGTYLYPTSTEGTGCPAEITCTLYRQGVAVSNPDVQNLGAGTYTYIYNTSGNTNYTTQSLTNDLTIGKNAGSCLVLANDTSPVIYPITFRVYSDCNSAITLYRNGTLTANNSEQALGVSAYNFTVMRTDTQNYSNIYNEMTFRVTPNQEKCQVFYNDTSPIVYPKTFLTWNNCTTAVTMKLNGTTISNNSLVNGGVGAYNISFLRTDTQNYSYIYNESQFRINKGTPVVNLSLNGAESNLPLTYPSQVTAVYGTNVLTATMYRNGTDVSAENNTAKSLAVGYYNYTVQNNGNTNWTSNVKTFFLTMFQNSTACGVYFNVTSPQAYPYPFIAYTTCTSAYTFTRNGTGISNASTQNLAVGYYNFSVQRTDTLNYSTNFDQQFFTITTAPDTTDPTPVLGTNPIDFYNNTASTSQFFEFKCFDDVAVANISLFGNWTSWSAKYTNTSYTNNTDLNKTINPISNGIYVWGVRCFDTTGNEAWSVNRTLRINYTAPYVPPSNVTGGGADCKYKKFGYYNLNLVWYREANCIE